MQTRWSQSLLVLFFAGGGLVATPATGVAGPGKHGKSDKHDKHNKPDKQHKRKHDVGRPHQAPPAPRAERAQHKRGNIWIAGGWDWRAGQWEWVAGHYEVEQKGKKWRDARWEAQGDSWVRVGGGWLDTSLHPTSAPPPVRAEKSSQKKGYIFVSGRWDWQNGEWQWLPGHWERFRKGKKWRDARWELREGGYVLDNGGWGEISLTPTAAPPPPQVEQPVVKAGYAWIAGRWDWKDSNWAWTPGHWERERANHRWNDGRWESRNNQWVWSEGSWVVTATAPPPPKVVGPRHAPPAPRAEASPQAKNGYVWIRGNYTWTNNAYAWVPGHWERAQAKKRWADGRWELRGEVWVWTAGGWN